MRIAIEAQRIFREKKHGMDIFALQLIKNLQQIDLENQYFIFVKPGPDRYCLKETRNFKIVELSGLTYLDWEQLSLPRALKKYKIDLLHCTSNTAPLFTDVSMVLTVHDIIYLTDEGAQKGTLYQKLGHYYRKYIVPQVAEKAQRVVTVSNYELEVMKSYFDPNKLRVVYNGVAEHFFDDERRNDLNLPDNYMFFLGNMAHKKNMRNLLKAYAWYISKSEEPVPLVIAETSDKELEALLTELGLSHVRNHIHLTGYVPQDQLPKLYASATVFLYPSLRESFGIPILEAMACGTPVITSNYASMPEVAGDCALLTESKDYQKLGAAIHYLMEDEELRLSMIEKGLRRADDFRWEEVAIKYASLYSIVNDNERLIKASV